MVTTLVNSLTLNEWLFELKNEIGIGVSDDDTYPLSTYHPINKEQAEIIKNYFYLYHNKISDINFYNDVLFKVQKRLNSTKDSLYTFNERYPSLEYFEQAVANTSSFIDTDLELYPNVVYHPISEDQKLYIINEFKKQSSRNQVYLESDLTSFSSNVVLLSDTPLDILPKIMYDGTNIEYS